MALNAKHLMMMLIRKSLIAHFNQRKSAAYRKFPSSMSRCPFMYRCFFVFKKRDFLKVFFFHYFQRRKYFQKDYHLV